MIEELLQTAGIKPTAARILIFRTLNDADHPVSMAEIGDRLETVDKSVISRTLSLFKSHDLLHTIQDGSDSVRYELCRSASFHLGDGDDQHIHFHCECCGKTFCFRNIPTPVPALPGGFRAKSVNFVINGVCPDCAGKSESGK
ncbi:MAG: Fur family transcriptional regulator [Candidatus Cryptobacteroides sp.]